MTQDKKIILYVAGALLILLVIFGIYSAIHPSSPSSSPISLTGTSTQSSDLPGLQTGDTPWLANIADLKGRLAAIGLPALPEEGTALHIHQHIDIFVHGKPVEIPAGIGIDELGGFISPIHVHDTTGVIHVESPTVQSFYLGQFFDIWGVAFDQNILGGYTTSATSTLRVYVNGKLIAGNPRDIELASHQEIVIAFGTESELPSPIPKSFAFDPEL